MNLYMITLSLPEEPTEDFFNLIPEQRKKVNELMQEGHISNYLLSADRTKLWVVASAKNPDELLAMLQTLPIFEYTEFEWHQVAFHNHVSRFIPSFSLN